MSRPARAPAAALTLCAALALATLGAARAAPPAATNPLTPFLAALDDHPQLRAARAALDAAEAQQRAARDPVALEASGGVQRSWNDEVDADPAAPGAQELPDSGGQLSASLTLRPVPFGDVADLADRRDIEAEQVRLDLRESRADLDARALTAALDLRLAEEGVAVARSGDALAREALTATRIRAERGVATDRDLRDAETGAAEAAALLADARDRLALAEATLRDLVGDAAAPGTEAIEAALSAAPAIPPAGEIDQATAVQRARLRLALAEIGPRGAQRALWPVASVGYDANLSDGSTVGISLESRTLQPRVTYAYQEPGRSFPQSATNGTLRVGVSWSVSLGAADALAAAEAQLAAARDGLEAAREGAALQRAALDGAAARSARQLELAERRLADARADLDEAQQRERLGLGTPLATLQAALDATRADLDLQSARRDALAATLDLYRFYARPVSEALP